MIVLDENSRVTDWLKEQNIESSGIARIDLATFELAKGFDSEIIVIEDTIYRQLNPILRDKLDCADAVLLFRSTSIPIDFYISSIVGEIGQKTPVQLIENQIQYIESQITRNAVAKSQMMTLNQELVEVMSGVDEQIERVKNVYKIKSPRRLEDFKGLTILSKYAAGENSGGEYFDLYVKENKIFIMMSSCSSFLASSGILQHFSELKEKKIIDTILEVDFINKVNQEIKQLNQSRKKAIDVELLTGIIDVSTLNFQGHLCGKFQILSSQLTKRIESENRDFLNMEESFFQLKLDRGERIMLNSPGFIKNWNSIKPDYLIEELIVDRKWDSLDIIDEVFFSLKKKSLNGFLTYDASSIILEVKNNVILKV